MLRANTERLDDPVQASKLALRSLATRVRDLDADNAEVAALDEHLCALFGHVAPAHPRSCRSKSRASQPSVVDAGRKIDCLHSEAALAYLCGVGPATASFGKTRRHRLSCGGDRDERAVNREARAGTEGAWLGG
jgi:transposase